MTQKSNLIFFSHETLREAAKKVLFLKVSGHRNVFFLVNNKVQKSFFFLVAGGLPPPPLSSRATKKKLRLPLSTVEFTGYFDQFEQEIKHKPRNIAIAAIFVVSK